MYSEHVKSNYKEISGKLIFRVTAMLFDFKLQQF